MLQSFASSINFPWMLMGDFNYNLNTYKKHGVNLIPPTRLPDFKNYLMDIELLDLSSSLLFFTWSNLQKDAPIQSKLDRVL